MSLWLHKTSELEARAFKWALRGSILTYALVVFGLFICFGPNRKTVSLIIPRSQKPAVVGFYTGKSRGKRRGNAVALAHMRAKMKGKRTAGSTSGRVAAKPVDRKDSKAIVKKPQKLSKQEALREVAKQKALEKKQAAKKQQEQVQKQELERQAREQREAARLRREKDLAAQKAAEKVAAVQAKQAAAKPAVPSKAREEKKKPEYKKSEPVKEIEKKPVSEEIQPVVPPKEVSLDTRKEQPQEESQDSTEAVMPEGVEEFGVNEEYGDEGGADDGYSREGAALIRSIGRAWKPPRGLSPALSARLVVSLGAKGTVEKIVIEKKSGVLAFDMAAKASLWRTEYPQAFWGKNIAVFFGRTK